MPMSYSTPKPRRWQSDLRGTDANSGDGWVGSLVDGLAFPELVQKSARSIGVRTACSNTDAGPAVPAVAALPRYTDGSRWYTCAAAAPHSARSRWLKTKTKVSRSHYSGLSAYGMIDIPVRRLSAYEAYTALGPYLKSYGFGLRES